MGNDQPWGHSLFRRPLSPSSILTWPIHRWLSWTNNIGLCSSKLVPQVSHELLRHLCLSCLQSLSRCTVPTVDLDSERHPPRSKEHTDLISAEFELGQLWDEYGLVGDVEVITHLIISIYTYVFSSHLQTLSLMPTFMSFHHLIYSINLLKVVLRIT